jgi:hypothetical protein
MAAILFFQNRTISPKKIAALSITLAGLALNLAIFFGVHRLVGWGFYLYPGTILTVAGLMLIIDVSLDEPSGNASKLFKRCLGLLGQVVALLLLCIATFSWAPYTVNALVQQAYRTNDAEYIQQYASYQQVMQFLGSQENPSNKTLQVMLTPSLFPPESGSKYQIIEFWGPYTQWSESPDVIIFGPINTPRGKPTPADSPDYPRFLVEREGYAMHVVENGSRCKATPCFERKLLLSNDGEILVLQK